jgi:hypothetical protein
LIQQFVRPNAVMELKSTQKNAMMETTLMETDAMLTVQLVITTIALLQHPS